MIADRMLRELLKSGVLSSGDSVLSVCGGSYDRDVFRAAGLTNATITNIDDQRGNCLSPYAWSRQDAESLTYPDNSYDVCFVSLGLHHCHSPHKALLEMYRVARRAVVVSENRDSLAMRIAVRLGLTEEYEVESVTGCGLQAGGVRNSPIPNFVYRWTEREVRKTVNSYDPRFKHPIRFFYDLRLPHDRLEHTPRPILRRAVRTAGPLLKLAFAMFPTQGNMFGFIIFKDEKLHPWLEWLPDGAAGVDLARVSSRIYDAA